MAGDFYNKGITQVFRIPPAMTSSSRKHLSGNTGFAGRFGFRFGDCSAHTSRTIMTAELAALLFAMPIEAIREEYRKQVVDENILGKRTGINRRLSFSRLVELYSLNPQVPIFRVLRRLWPLAVHTQPLLALLCAAARDPVLRMTAKVILLSPPGSVLGTANFVQALSDEARGRFGPKTLLSTAQNASSSWTQSGHLRGRVRKIRIQAAASPAAAAYALFLGTCEGVNGGALFETLWARLLDQPVHELIQLAEAASRQGLITFRHVGAIMDIRCSPLLTRQEEEWIHEQS